MPNRCVCPKAQMRAAIRALPQGVYTFRDRMDDVGPDTEPVEAQVIQVFVMNADGSGATALTTLPSENGHPAWSRGRAHGLRHAAAVFRFRSGGDSEVRRHHQAGRAADGR